MDNIEEEYTFDKAEMMVGPRKGNYRMNEFALMVSSTEEPKSFREAWDHPDPTKREKWRTAIRKEFRDMI